MASYKNLQDFNSGQTFMFQKSPRHVTGVFNQEDIQLRNNQPLMPFEYYVSINLNNIDTARNFIVDYYDTATLSQIEPLIKSVDMPSVKLESSTLDQYNRKRIVQTNVSYDPIKMVFHDVADGKTLRFWEMYFRYYFGDATEPGINQRKTAELNNGEYINEQGIGNFTSVLGIQNRTIIPFDNVGDKRSTNNIISDTLNSHIFGYNLSAVQNIKHLISSIEIFQVHGGRYNSVTLVNPRISQFNHSTLDYSKGDSALEITFTIDYEYAFYNLYNQQIGGTEPNNNSSMSPFLNSIPLEITNSQPLTIKVNDDLYSRNMMLGGLSANQSRNATQAPLSSLVNSSKLVDKAVNSVSNFSQNIIGTASMNDPFPIFSSIRNATSSVLGSLPPVVANTAAGLLQGRSLKQSVTNSVLSGVISQLPPQLAPVVEPFIGARSFKSAAANIKNTAVRSVFRDLTRAR